MAMAISENLVTFAGVEEVKYPQESWSYFFMCQSCRSHLFGCGNCLHRDEELHIIICNKVVNVRVGNVVRTVRLYDYDLDVATVTCNRCNLPLGEIFVRVPEPRGVVQEGRFQLELEKLLCWNGRQVISANHSEFSEGKPVKVMSSRVSRL